jgi:lipopolysaccharide transport system ATP-binding protein
MSESDVVIRVEGLGKRYALHHEKIERYTSLRDILVSKAKASGRLLNPFTLAGHLRRSQRHSAQDRTASEDAFWALKDVNFEIRRGERVGIIGRNGAGKSTLLKILSRITEPTTGRVEICGRVASLLEVGTGFHPELTGRENIFLNGAILGMTRREILSRFDEIVVFAEVEKFLDTPVKRYSSGMYVRLAFAVAAHLEPEILVVDEVLAVGDASFQKKCLGKMEEVSSKDKRTVIFVSHNLSAIGTLCTKGLYLANGRTPLPITSTELAIQEYLGSAKSSSYTVRETAVINKKAWIERAEITDDSGSSSGNFRVGSPLSIKVEYKCSLPIHSLGLGAGISTSGGARLTSFNNYNAGITLPSPRSKPAIVTIKINDLNLAPGSYTISLSLVEDEVQWLDLQNDCISFTIVDNGFYHAGRSLSRDQALVWSKPTFLVSSCTN